MSPEDLLLQALEANVNGYPLPDDVEEAVSDALRLHLESGISLDRALGLTGGRGRNARTKAKIKIRNDNLRKAFDLFSDYWSFSEAIDILMEEVNLFLEQKYAPYFVNGMDEDADLLDVYIAKAVFVVGGRMPRSKEQYIRIINMG
ncbi:MAG: hypothetical protein B6D73_15195 [gamma proteobacterium symbiont of Stewartia floridana]|nr:MAG: hypothetical protein B6D73_15195 [gamma proteobacterium symbiont of Stewartia floridana]